MTGHDFGFHAARQQVLCRFIRLWIRITYFIPSRFIHACEFIALFWLMWSKMTKS